MDKRDIMGYMKQSSVALNRSRATVERYLLAAG